MQIKPQISVQVPLSILRGHTDMRAAVALPGGGVCLIKK